MYNKLSIKKYICFIHSSRRNAQILISQNGHGSCRPTTNKQQHPWLYTSESSLACHPQYDRQDICFLHEYFLHLVYTESRYTCSCIDNCIPMTISVVILWNVGIYCMLVGSESGKRTLDMTRKTSPTRDIHTLDLQTTRHFYKIVVKFIIVIGFHILMILFLLPKYYYHMYVRSRRHTYHKSIFTHIHVYMMYNYTYLCRLSWCFKRSSERRIRLYISA